MVEENGELLIFLERKMACFRLLGGWLKSAKFHFPFLFIFSNGFLGVTILPRCTFLWNFHFRITFAPSKDGNIKKQKYTER